MSCHCFDNYNRTRCVSGYIFCEGAWSASSQFFFHALKISDIYFSLPGCRRSGELFSLQKYVRSLVLASDFGSSAFIVFMRLSFIFFYECFGAVEGRFLLEMEESG